MSCGQGPRYREVTLRTWNPCSVNGERVLSGSSSVPRQAEVVLGREKRLSSLSSPGTMEWIRNLISNEISNENCHLGEATSRGLGVGTEGALTQHGRR